MADIKYKRVVLKLSGEALAGEAGHGIRVNKIFPRTGIFESPGTLNFTVEIFLEKQFESI